MKNATLLQRYLYAIGGAAWLCAIFLITIESDPKKAILFGFSIPRIGLILVLFLCGLVPLWLVRRRFAACYRVFSRFVNAHIPWVVILGLTTLLILFSLGVWFLTRQPSYFGDSWALFQRISPFIVWLVIVCFSTLVVLILCLRAWLFSQKGLSVLCHLSVASFLPTVLFILPVNAIYQSNPNEIAYDYQLSLIGGGLYIVVTVLGYWMISGQRNDRLARIWIFLGILPLIWDLTRALVDTVNLNAILLALLEGVLLFGVWWLSRSMDLQKMITVFAAVAVVLFFSGWLQHLQILQRSYLKMVGRNPVTEMVAEQPVSATNATTGNVYHIILDAYQSEAYAYLTQKASPAEKTFPFTYYPRFLANSNHTWASIALLWRGEEDTIIQTENLPQWQLDSYQEAGFVDDLVKQGISVHQYPYYDTYCHQQAVTCKPIQDFKSRYFDRWNRQTIIDMTFLKWLPETLSDFLGRQNASTLDWDYGFSISDFLFPSELPGDKDKPYFSLIQYEQLLEDEALRPAHGQYVFAHLILPHVPFIFDRNCHYVGKTVRDLSDQEKYLEQTRCANLLIDRLINRLKELNRLDSAMIIIHADHGYYLDTAEMGILQAQQSASAAVTSEPGKAQAEDFTSPAVTVQNVAARSAALLLIKKPNQQASEVSPAPVQVIDLAPTILDYFGLDTGKYPMQPLKNISPSSSRTRRFLVVERQPRQESSMSIQIFEEQAGNWQRTR